MYPIQFAGIIESITA